MSENLPRLTFRRMIAPPPPESLQFFDGVFPALPAGPYTLHVTHEVTPPLEAQLLPGEGPPRYELGQAFIVQAPEFQLDPTLVASVSPADGASAIVGHEMPTIVLNDASLPWERSLVPGGSTGPEQGRPSWLALLLFAENEIYLQPDTSTPVKTSTVADLLAAEPATTLVPKFPNNWISDDLLQSQCQSIVIPGTSWSLLPSKYDLKYLAHCRAVNAPDEDSGTVSVVFGNRLPLAKTPPAPAALQYYAHLVSLEGFADYLEPGLPLPTKPSGGPVDVQMVSLYSWSFVSLPDDLRDNGIDFGELIVGLIASEAVTPVLRLPRDETPMPQVVADRLHQGYAPLTLQSLSGEQSFAWYRGPFTAVVAQELPEVGNPATPVSEAKSADELMIYLEDQGLFDLSYAAAWTMGRDLALANLEFAKAMSRFRRTARAGVQAMAHRRSMPIMAGASLAALPQYGAVTRSFSHAVGAGLARQWHHAMREIGSAGERGGPPPRLRKRRPARVTAMDVLAQSGATEALAVHVAEATDSVAEWLASLERLEPVPFSSLVPDARMLPAESIRFFYIDQTWIDALIAGALSLGLFTRLDAAIAQMLTPSLMNKVKAASARRMKRRFGPAQQEGAAPRKTGLLIRSMVISSWPTLAIGGKVGEAPLDVVRDAVLAPGVRLVIFNGVPETVMLAEPYQGLQFGVPESGIAPRYVTESGPIGEEILGATPVPPGGYEDFLNIYTRAGSGGVVMVTALADALITATGAGADFGAGDFALQMVNAPEMQRFRAE